MESISDTKFGATDIESSTREIGDLQDQFQTFLNHQYNHPDWYKQMQPYWDAIPARSEVPKLNMKEDLLPFLQEPKMV
jgi:hypothetical protein